MNNAQTPKPDPILEVTNAILAHPGFDSAALYYFENVMKWRREIGFADKFMSGYTRHLILYFVFYLHFTNETGLPENGASFGRIWDLVDQRKECGSRALRTILGISSLVGYLDKVPGQVDKRAVAYVPTEAVLASSKAHLENMMKCLDIILDSDIYAKEVKSDPDFIAKSMWSIGVPIKEHEIVFIEIDPLLAKVARTSGGMATLFAIAEAQLKKTPLAHPKKIAKTGRFSTSQIRVNIKHLTEIGAVNIDAKTNQISESHCTLFSKTLLARELALHVKFRLGIESKFLGTPKT
jgi:hypothetical protein